MSAVEVGDLVVSLVNSLAWPLLFAFLALLFKPQVTSLIGLIHNIKYKGLEINLNQSVEKVVEGATKALSEVSDPPPEPNLQQMSDTDPRITILYSWASLENAIRRLALANREVLGLSVRVDRMSARRIIQTLHQSEIINSSLADILYEMGELRNLIAHAEDISSRSLDPDIVERFARAASRVTQIVERRMEPSGSPC